MMNAPLSSTPVSAVWPGTTLVAAAGTFRAVDLPAREFVWAVEITAPGGGDGLPRPPSVGMMLATPISALGLPADPVVSVPTVRVSDRGWITEPDDADAPNLAWPARLVEAPALEMQIPLYPSETRRTEVTAGEIILANGDGAMDGIAGDWSLAGRSVIIRRGPHRRPRHAAINEVGRIAEMRVSTALDGGSRLRLVLVSAARDLTVPACRLFAGTGGLEGMDTLAGQPKPRLYGQRLNFEPVLIEAARLIYSIHDGPIGAVTGVRDRAVSLAPAGDTPSFQALQAATVASATYLTCLATGHIRVGSSTSLLTVSARGDALGGYAISAATIASRLLTGPGGVTPDRAPADAFSAWPTEEVGLLLNGGTVGEAMERLAAGVGGWWGADAFGRFYGGALIAPEERGPSVVLQPWMLSAPPQEERQANPPWYGTRVAYRILDRVQSGEEIAGVADEVRAYYGQANEQVPAFDGTAQAAYPAAVDGGVVESLFLQATPASAMAARLMGLFSKPRRIWRVALRGGVGGIAPQMLVPGSVVSLTWPQTSALAHSRALLVQRLSIRGDNLEMRLWG